MNIGLIGFGYWGPNLLRNFAAVPGVRVTAVADLRPERLDIVAHAYPGVGLLTADAREVIRGSGWTPL